MPLDSTTSHDYEYQGTDGKWYNFSTVAPEYYGWVSYNRKVRRVQDPILNREIDPDQEIPVNEPSSRKNKYFDNTAADIAMDFVRGYRGLADEFVPEDWSSKPTIQGIGDLADAATLASMTAPPLTLGAATLKAVPVAISKGYKMAKNLTRPMQSIGEGIAAIGRTGGKEIGKKKGISEQALRHDKTDKLRAAIGDSRSIETDLKQGELELKKLKEAYEKNPSPYIKDQISRQARANHDRQLEQISKEFGNLYNNAAQGDKTASALVKQLETGKGVRITDLREAIPHSRNVSKAQLESIGKEIKANMKGPQIGTYWTGAEWAKHAGLSGTGALADRGIIEYLRNDSEFDRYKKRNLPVFPTAAMVKIPYKEVD